MSENEISEAKTVKEIHQLLDFVLVRQKDYILKLIEDGRYAEVGSCLACLDELWYVCGYSYKSSEIIHLMAKHLTETRRKRDTYKTGAISNQP